MFHILCNFDWQNGDFWLNSGCLNLYFDHFWSLNQLVVETLGVAPVRPYVRLFATLFLGNRSSLFSETLPLVRAYRCEKIVQSAFLIIFTVLAILAKNCPKWPFLPKNDQNGGFWHFFLEPRIRISLFFARSIVSGV